MKPGDPYRVEVLIGGVSTFLKTSEAVWKRVLGDVDVDMMRAPRRSLRRMVGKKFLCWEDKDGVIQAIDQIPTKYYERGAVPVKDLDARERGFLMDYDEDLEGFVVNNTYAGMTERQLHTLIGELRESKAFRTTKRFEGHRVEKVDAVTLRVSPLNIGAYTN